MLPQMTQWRGEREGERKRRQMSLQPPSPPGTRLCVRLFDAGEKRLRSYLRERKGRPRTRHGLAIAKVKLKDENLGSDTEQRRCRELTWTTDEHGRVDSAPPLENLTAGRECT